ncbi:MAG: complex I subunit 1 family protein [Candidatus Omnitrophota bacterium]
MIPTMLYLIIFPGIAFVTLMALVVEFIDRKLYARLQNRKGPPWFQPLADMIKLLAKEEVIPDQANARIFSLAPLVALTAVLTAWMYIPLWSGRALQSFEGDIIVILYLLTIPTLAFFIGGWYSCSLYARIGTMRSLTQLFAYEVPLFVGILAAALLANTWSLSTLIIFYRTHPWYWLCNVIGFSVSLIALVGKLEKTPFDIPEAETEIVAGTFTEYSGRLLAVIRLTFDIEAVAGCALLAAVFMPFWMPASPVLGCVVFLIKIFMLTFVIALFRTIFARLRLDQMVNFCWRYVAPLAILQIIINLILKGILPV